MILDLSFDYASSFDSAQDDKMLVQDDKMNGHVRSLQDDKSSEQARLFSSEEKKWEKI